MTERLYRALLRLFPADFRDRFGEDMVQLFHDKLRDARTGHAPWGTVSAWLGMLGDVVAMAASERLRRNRQVAHSLSSRPPLEERVLGIAGIVGGAVLLTAFVIDVPSGLNAMRIALFNLGAIAVVIAVLRRSVPASLLAIGVGVVVILVNALYGFMALADIHAVAPLWAGVALWLTTALFGLNIVREGGLTRWGALALAVGSVLAVTGIDRLGLVSATSPTVFNTLAQVGIVTVGLGWVVLGIDVATRRAVPQPAP